MIPTPEKAVNQAAYLIKVLQYLLHVQTSSPVKVMKPWFAPGKSLMFILDNQDLQIS